MSLAPVPMSARELRQLLHRMTQLAGDRHSFDGSIEYHAWDGPACSLCGGLAASEEGVRCEHCQGAGFEPLPAGTDYWVNGVVRDNSDGGQGFVTIVGRMLDSEGRPLGDLSAL